MDIRHATSEDIDGIRGVARASLAASYGHALDEDVIESAVERWYSADSLAADLADDDTYFIVATDSGKVVGFVQSYVVSRRERIGEIDWLHVDPDNRGRGIGTDLMAYVERELLSSDVTRLEGSVLVDNEMGAEFYESHGFSSIGERTVDIGGSSFDERVYTKFPEGTEEESDLGAHIEEHSVGDQSVFVTLDETVRGSDAVFYAVYTDSEREERYGWMCDCGNFSVAMDTMERLQCGECGNKSKATRWDAAYL